MTMRTNAATSLILLLACLIHVNAFLAPSVRSRSLLNALNVKQPPTTQFSFTKSGPLFRTNDDAGSVKLQMSQEEGAAVAASSLSSKLAAVSKACVALFQTKTAVAFLGAFIVGAIALLVKINLTTPSRPYNQEINSVGKEYDAWTEEGILEYYWGEHIHLGYYEKDEVRKNPLLPPKVDFIQAKYNFIDKMMAFGGIYSMLKPPATILDVGCGIGGTSRYLASKLGKEVQVTGITLSPNQVARGTELAKERGLDNVQFKVMDALKMDFADNSFDMVWACESGEHMPDKKKYIEEMARVLKPGGRIIMATWCQRHEEGAGEGSDKPGFTAAEKRHLNYLYDEWTHPYFISIKDYKNLMLGTGELEDVVTSDWNKETRPAWRHSIWAGVFDPLPVVVRPWVWVKTVRDICCLESFHRSFARGLMGYGMFTAVKKDKKNTPEIAPAC